MASPSFRAFSATTNAPIASIGVPTEIKRDEQRVALNPGGVRELVSHGRELVSHGLELRIQSQAGAGAGSSDAGFAAAGAQLVSAELVHQMRPGSGIVDVAIDQGGCIATSRETTHTEPVVTIHGGPTEALVSVTLPSSLAIAGRDLAGTGLGAEHDRWGGLPSGRGQGPGGAEPPSDGLPGLNG